MTYKILHDKLVRIIFNHEYYICSSIRFNGLRIYKSHFNKTFRKYDFSQRIIEHWNRLPSEIANLSDVLSYKTQLSI